MRCRYQPAFINCQRGASALEFALVAPILIALILGGVSCGVLVYSAAGLRDAAEQAARCYSVNSSQCGTASQTQTYAKSAYYGISTPTFTASIQSCGHQVAATVTVQLTTVIVDLSVPLTANACFP
jgi:Flp pilus assembly protein TadG